ncbi:MAG TPA: hypothetical protein VEH53_07165 [archaeon]|nr:hypothetical protein [archaeon]
MNTKLRIGLVLSALVVVLWTVVAVPAVDAATKGIAEVKAQDAVGGAWMGASVAIGEGMMVVGAPLGNAAAALPTTGAVYVFGYDQATGAWDQDSKLTAQDPAPFALFGWSVGTNNALIAVGAPTGSAAKFMTGVVYLYRHDATAQAGTWVQAVKIAADSPAFGDRFGWSVGMANDLLVVGAPRVDLPGGLTDSGAVYVFRVACGGATGECTWEQEAKLTATDVAMGGAQFGTSVATDGETIVVGAPFANAAYVFRFNGSGWDQGEKLSGTPGSEFGWSVAMSNGTIVVGAPGADAAHTFRFDGTAWVEEGPPLNGKDALAGSQFGYSVAIDGDMLVVGAPYGLTDDGMMSGYAYALRYDEKTNAWKPAPRPKLVDENATENEEFGFAVALQGNKVAVGALDAGAGQTGSVSEFTINRPPLASATVDHPEVHEGDTVKLDGSASTDPDGDNLTYTWVQMAGPTVNFDGTAMQFGFQAPPVPAEGATLTFQLTVNDGEEASDPAEVSVLVTKPACHVTSHLGEKRSWIPDQDSFTFQGKKGDTVTLTLQADGNGSSHGQRAVLALQDRIRGTWFFRADRGALPKEIKATLPATGEYLVTVMDDPFCWRGARYRGDYVLSLEGASGCLEPTHRCLTVKKKVELPANSCHQKEGHTEGFWF